MVLVIKKELILRICVDYRALHLMSHKDAFLHLRGNNYFEALIGATICCIFDLAKGYYQVAKKPDDKVKTAFTTQFHL